MFYREAIYHSIVLIEFLDVPALLHPNFLSKAALNGVFSLELLIRSLLSHWLDVDKPRQNVLAINSGRFMVLTVFGVDAPAELRP